MKRKCQWYILFVVKWTKVMKKEKKTVKKYVIVGAFLSVILHHCVVGSTE